MQDQLEKNDVVEDNAKLYKNNNSLNDIDIKGETSEKAKETSISSNKGKIVLNTPDCWKSPIQKYRDYSINDDDIFNEEFISTDLGKERWQRKFFKDLVGKDYLDFMGILDCETNDQFFKFLQLLVRRKKDIRSAALINIVYRKGVDYYCEHRRITLEEYEKRVNKCKNLIRTMLLKLIELPKFELQIKYPMYDLSRQTYKNSVYEKNGETIESLKRKDDSFNRYFHTESPFYERAFYIAASDFNYRYIVENGYKIEPRHHLAMNARRISTSRLITVYVSEDNKFSFISAGPIYYYGETLSTKDFIRILRGDIKINFFEFGEDSMHFEKRILSEIIYKYNGFMCMSKLKDGVWVEPEWYDIEPTFDDYVHYLESLTDEDAVSLIFKYMSKAKKNNLE